MSPFILIILIVLPGAWISFRPQLKDLSWKACLALGIALSPVVVGIEVCFLKLIGLPFRHIVFVSVLTSIPSIILIVRDFNFKEAIQRWPVAIFGFLVFMILTMCALFPSLYQPKYRSYARHALLHTDICYAVSTNRLQPEEPNLAGMRLRYPWFSHIHWSVIGYACDWPPTFVWILTNIAFLAGTCILAYETSKVLGVHPSTGILGVGLLALGTNFLGKISSLAKSGFLDWSRIFSMTIRGDPRYTPFLLKYTESSAMPAGLSLFCGLVLVSVLICRKKCASLWAMGPILLASVGLVYPAIFPPAFVLMVCLIGILFILDAQDGLHYNVRGICFLALGIILATFIGYSYFQLINAGSSRSITELASVNGIFRRIAYSVMVFAPLAIPACRPAWHALRKRCRAILLLLSGTLAAVAMNVVLRLENGIEYKFILCAAICLTPLTVAGLDPLTARWPKFRWMLALILPGLLAPFMISTSIAYIPWELPNAIPLDENSFKISLDPSDSNSFWTRTVRNSTPKNTVLVVYKPAFVFSAYTSRSMFVVESPNNIIGYGLSIEENLLDIRGYPVDVYKERLLLVERLYTECDPLILSSCLEELRKLQRPIALHFSGEQGSGLLKFMKANKIGSELVSDGVHLVWYIELHRDNGNENS
jgi:hypothetical protein